MDQVGIPVLDQNGLEIVVRGVKTDDNLMGPEIMLFLSNQTGQNITVQANDFSINGYMITPLLSCDIIDGELPTAPFISTLKSSREDRSHRYNRMQVCRTQPEHRDTIFESDPVSIRIPN